MATDSHPTKSSFERSKELASPVREWFAQVAYEGTWTRLLCEPEPEPFQATYDKLKKAENRLRQLEFFVYCTKSRLAEF